MATVFTNPRHRGKNSHPICDMKESGFQRGPRLALGDGAISFWAALVEVVPAICARRCWFHYMGNVLNALPTSQHARAERAHQGIWMAATRKAAHAAIDRFFSGYDA